MFVYVFVLFGDGDDVGCFPDNRNDVRVERAVVEVCEVLYCVWAQVFEMSDVNVVGAE